MTITLADAWLHTLSPFLVRFTSTLGIRYYGLAYAFAFLFGYLMLRTLSTRGLVRIPPHRVGDALLAIVLGVVLGGRIGYVLLYDPALILDLTSSPPWWGVLAINKGGMASHGGIVGVIVASWWISRGWKTADGTIEGRCSMLHVLDAMALLAPLGLGLGRLANFVNGELLGKIAALPGQPSPWWSVKFPQEILTSHYSGRTAAQVDALNALASRYARPGELLSVSYERLIAMVQAGGTEGHRVATELGPLLAARHPSQLYQAFAEGLVLGITLFLIWAKPRKPGVVGAWFMILYGVLRITTELWRLPDDILKVQRVLGLSRGQWFSAIMVLVGVVVLVRVLRSDTTPIGGWKNRARAEGKD